MAAQQTPAPIPGRSYLGLLLYILGWTGIVCYLTWALFPHHYLNSIGITYLPQQYWAIAIPSLLIMGVFLFITLVYPGLNMMLAVPPHDIRNLVDEKTICIDSYSNSEFYLPHIVFSLCRQNHTNDYMKSRNKNLDVFSDDKWASVPPVYDLPISDVCHILYGNELKSFNC